MAEPMSRAEFINNPFMVAVHGVNLLFLKAQGVAIFLIILALVSYAPNINNNQPSLPGNLPHIASLNDILPYLPVIIGAVIIALATWLLIASFISGVTGYTTARIARGSSVTLSEAAKASLHELPGLIWLQFLMTIKLIGWTLLLIVPGVIMSVRYRLATTAYFDQKLKGNAAIQRSIALTQGSWTTTFASTVLFNSITFNIITPLVDTAVAAVLYRQYSETPADQRPTAHWLSVVLLSLLIAAAAIALVGIAFLWQAFKNYTTNGHWV